MDTLSLFRNLSQRNPGSVVFTSAYLTPLPLDRNSVVADLGCGLGSRATWVARSRCCEMHLFDQDTSRLDQAYARGEEGGSENLMKLHYVENGNYQSIDMEPQSFDLIMTEGLSFELNPFDHISSWFPLLKDGGSIALVVPGLTHSEVPQEVKAFLKQRSTLDLGTLDDYHERLAQFDGLKLLHQVTLAQYSWDEHYQNLGRCIKGLIKSGEMNLNDPLLRAAQEELVWYRQQARGHIFLQAFVLSKHR